jgi:hypothetical protein
MLISREINGVKYTARYLGIKYAFRVQEECSIEGTEQLNIELLAQRLFDEVIVEPKGLKIEDFDEYNQPLNALLAVIDFAKDVMINGGDKRLTKVQSKERVKRDWAMWRLILSDIANFDYYYVFNQMTPQEIKEANIAIDIAIEQMKSQK